MKTVQQIKVTMPAIEAEITNLLASIYDSNPELRDDDDFKKDILEGSTDFLDIINKLLLELSITNGFLDGIKDSISRLEGREGRLWLRKEAIRTILQRLLTVAEMRKVEVPNGSVSIKNKSPSVEIVDEGLIPEKFMRITKAPSKTLIGDALKAGEDVPGARMSNGGETIAIR